MLILQAHPCRVFFYMVWFGFGVEQKRPFSTLSWIHFWKCPSARPSVGEVFFVLRWLVLGWHTMRFMCPRPTSPCCLNTQQTHSFRVFVVLKNLGRRCSRYLCDSDLRTYGTIPCHPPGCLSPMTSERSRTCVGVIPNS